uniref:Uncharacterized protein n=1 Tax=Aureimonas altamirensis TaxID=370622 RepID=A0A0P0YY07_9HYPH|nr:hypothetical protein [Aureimonas altamirensis]
MDMIRMRMGQNDGIQVSHLGIQHLIAEIRPAVDGNRRHTTRAVPAHKGGSPPAPVAWLGWVAGAPIAVDARHAGR